METRNCQNCKNDFLIDADDFAFYEKIKVPPPTFCPECRMVRRLLWRNSRSLHKRTCQLCNKNLISMYADETVPVICGECYNGGNWDPYQYARDYDFSKPFFTQLKEHFQTVPRFYAYRFGNLINSDYCNFAKDDKNCYLSYSVIVSEDIQYSEMVDYCKNSIDCFAVNHIDGCSNNVDCEGNYNSHFMVQSQNCLDSYFLYDCANSTNCCMSWGLRSGQYVFKNQKLSKEDYQAAVAALNLHTASGLEKAKAEFDEMLKNEAIHKYAFIYSAENATGDYIHNAKNAKRCFHSADVENVAYSNRAIEIKDCYDCGGVGFQAELIYESMAATQNTSSDFFCYLTIQGCRNCEYSMICRNCVNCFGCIGMINAKYCIFNKQYTEAEYFEMVKKIKQHMDEMPYIDAQGRVFKYGEFFPHDMSPYGYNETNAQDYFHLSKEEALAKGYPWRDRTKRDYVATKQAHELPDSINDVDDAILQEVIACPNDGNPDFLCTTAYRITADELRFYRNKKLPLPHFCPNCRHYQRLLSYRNPFKLYSRSCTCNQTGHGHEGPCQNTFETSYAPDRPEKVYCESCYQKAVL